MKGDSRYNQWLNIHHPEEKLDQLSRPFDDENSSLPGLHERLDLDSSDEMLSVTPGRIDLDDSAVEIPSCSPNKVKTLTQTSVLQKFLSNHTQQNVKVPKKETKTSARVLTSLENRLAVEEKERIKRQKAEEKSERAKARALKQQEKKTKTG